MPDGGLWVNLGAEPTGIDRLQTYDASTDAFIPITADQTIVAENEPEPQRGLLWFEPVDGGLNLYAASSIDWEFLHFIPDIPDSENWEHNDLTGRYIGDTGQFNIQQDTVISGNHTLAGSGDGSFHTIVQDATYKWNRDNIRIDCSLIVDGSNPGSVNLAFGNNKAGISSFSGYGIYVDNTNSRLRIDRWDNGSKTNLKSNDSASYTTGSETSGYVEFDGSGTITAELDGATVSADDDTYSNLYLGCYFRAGGYIDDIAFTDIS